MELRKNKRVGKVLLIVEGARHEFNLVKKIFVDILGYTQIENRRRSAKYYVREGDRHSVVAVVNTKTSNISSVDEKEYLDAIFENLIEQYDFDINNAAIYYFLENIIHSKFYHCFRVCLWIWEYCVRKGGLSANPLYCYDNLLYSVPEFIIVFEIAL